MSSKHTYLLVALLTFLASAVVSSASAHSYRHGDISIGHVWAPVPNDPAIVNVYGPLLNTGATEDVIIAVQSPIAQSARFQREEEGAIKDLEKITLAPGKPVSLAEWGPYIRLEGLSAPLEAGESFPLTLTFEKAGEIIVEVMVEADTPDH